MMQVIALLTLLLVNAVSSQTFSPNLTKVTCDPYGNMYEFTVTGVADEGAIYIDGACGAEVTAANQTTYKFLNSSCTPGPFPELGTNFKLVVQQFPSLNLPTDYIVEVNCTLNTATVTLVSNFSYTGVVVDDTAAGYLSPTFDLFATDIEDEVITSGTVGSRVKLKFSITDVDAVVFRYKVLNMTARAGTSTVDVIVNGCSEYDDIIQDPPLPTKGSLALMLNLFIPMNTSDNPSLPNKLKPTIVTFEFQVQVCAGPCEATNCSASARKRRDTESDSDLVDLSTALIVYPAGYKEVNADSTVDTVVDEEETKECLSNTSLLGVLIALSVALLICMIVTSWMFCLLKRSSKDSSSKASFVNQSYKA